MEDNVAKIKARLDIVDVISDYLKLQKSGVNYKARCPIHNEKTASFFISPERQTWHCFGCSRGGDMFGFIQEIEGVDFKDALKLLAEKAGVELGLFVSQSGPEKSRKEILFDICELATKFFEKQLWYSNSGKKALTYLRNRGVTDQSVTNFRIGYAPNSSDALRDFLIVSGYDSKDIFDAGLIGRNDRQQTYDRFRARIIFPIFDITHRVIGFSGRIFEEDLPQNLATIPAKYINTPQTQIYDKSSVLYGLDRARLDIKRQNKCVLVEGNLDVVLSHQVGATHAVASSGTALTENHLKIIKRYTDNLDLCFDADTAGIAATDRGVDLAIAHGMNVGIIGINEHGIKDAADYVKKYGPGWLEYINKSSRPFLDFYINFSTKLADITTALGKKLISQKILPLIKTIPNQIEQSHWLNELALVLKVKEELLTSELAQTNARIKV